MRLIDGDSLADVLTAISSIKVDTGRSEEWVVTVNAARQAIAQMPTIEPKKGKWIDMGDFEQCSVCTGTHLKEINTVYGKAIWIKSAYCPNCGARMENSHDSN